MHVKHVSNVTFYHYPTDKRNDKCRYNKCKD